MATAGTKLFYDGNEILDNQPTPFVGRTDSIIRYGERWADQVSFSLHGQITGCTFTDLLTGQNALINIFSRDFQQFKVTDNGSGIYTGNYCLVRPIRFEASNYAYRLNYDVQIDCYQFDLFSGFYGVLDPTDEWSFEESNNYTVALTHTVSARGFNTNISGANGLQNAKSFVNTRTGIAGIVVPVFITGKGSGINYCLKEAHEKIDRFNGTYSIVERYVGDSYYGVDGLLRYTSNFDCNALDGLAKVTVQGNIDGCNRTTSMSGLRARYSGLSPYGIASNSYFLAGGSGLLNSGFISQGITEDPISRKLSFNVVYDNDPNPLVFVDYGVTVSLSENEITTVAFQGTIKGRGDIGERWQRVLAFYSGFNPFPYAQIAYAEFATGSSFPLNSTTVNESTTFDQFNAQISINETWDNKDIPPGPFKTFSYTLRFTPALEKVSSTPLAGLCDPQFYIVDLGYKTRCEFSIEGKGVVCPPNSIDAGVFYVKQKGNTSFTKYCPLSKATLDSNVITTNEQDINFKFAWSAQSPNSVTSPGQYSGINTLSLK